MSAGGFGICGHKNTYNSRVLNGNFVEDRRGKQLGDDINRKVYAAVLSSTTSDSYANPRKQPVPNQGPEINMDKLNLRSMIIIANSRYSLYYPVTLRLKWT